MSKFITDARAAGFVAHWSRVGPILEEVSRLEQRALSEEDHLVAVANVLQLAKPDPTPTRTSGLVEMHRLFSKERR